MLHSKCVKEYAIPKLFYKHFGDKSMFPVEIFMVTKNI